MAWNGSGTYVLNPAFSPEVNGTTIDAVRYNGLTSDVATGITQAINKNGENSPTANINWGGFKLTNLAVPTVAGDAISWGTSPTLGTLSVNRLVVSATAISYGTWNASTAATSFWGLQTAAANYGYLGTTEGIAGVAGGWGARSETFFSIYTAGGSERIRILASGDTCVGAISQAGIGSGADKLAVSGTIGFTSQLNGNSATFSELVQRGVGGWKIYTNVGSVTAGIISAAGNWSIGNVTPLAGVPLMVHTAANQNVGAFSVAGAAGIAGFTDAGASAALKLLGTTLTLSGDGTNDHLSIATTGAITALGVALTKVKTAVTSRQSTTTFADDPHLIQALAVGTYAVNLWIPFNCISNGAMGMKAKLNFTGTQTNLTATFLCNENSFGSQFAVDATTGMVAAALTTSPAPGSWMQVMGTIVVTVAGNLSLQWAQNSSTAVNLNFNVGGYMTCMKLA